MLGPSVMGSAVTKKISRSHCTSGLNVPLNFPNIPKVSDFKEDVIILSHGHDPKSQRNDVIGNSS